MSRSLPPNPSFRFLQKQAKDLLKAHRQHDPGACPTLRLLHRFAGADARAILTAEVALHEAQFALALEYGFASWAAMKAHVGGPPQAPAREYSSLNFQGHCMRVDSFSLSVQAAARLLGLEVDYDSACVLSTNPACLAICLGEQCTAWWHMYARGVCMDLVGRALGLKFRRLELPDAGARPNMSDAESADVTRRTRELHGPILRRELAEGAVLITEGGWQVTGGPYGFIPWCLWGVITVAAEDDLRGATLAGNSLQGHWDTPLAFLADVYAVRPAERTLDAPAARREMLGRSAARIRGGQPPFLDGRVLFGLPGMDKWIGQMAEVPGFCPVCSEGEPRGWQCARSSANAADAGAELMARSLRASGAEPASAGRSSLSAAADCYDRIRGLLGPAIRGEQDGYKAIVGDMARQKAHADTILQPVKAELASAAEHMERALAAL